MEANTKGSQAVTDFPAMQESEFYKEHLAEKSQTELEWRSMYARKLVNNSAQLKEKQRARN